MDRKVGSEGRNKKSPRFKTAFFLQTREQRCPVTCSSWFSHPEYSISGRKRGVEDRDRLPYLTPGSSVRECGSDQSLSHITLLEEQVSGEQVLEEKWHKKKIR